MVEKKRVVIPIKFKRQAVELNYDPKVQGVTQSLLKMKKECEVKARMYARGYVRNTNRSKAQAQGGVFHYGLEFIRRGQLDGTVKTLEQALTLCEKLPAEFQRHFNDEYLGLDEYSRKEMELAYGVASIMLPFYFRFWAKDFSEEKKQWVELERQGKYVEAESGIPIRFKCDGIYRLTKTGRLWLDETKTKDRWNEEYIAATTAREFQVLLYELVTWRDRGEVPEGVLKDVIRRPQLRLGTNETIAAYCARVKADVMSRPDFYFVRYEVPCLEKDLVEFERRLKLELDAYKKWWDRGHKDDLENTDACFNFNKPCVYMDYCNSRRKNLTGLEIRPDTHDKYKTIAEEEEA